MVRVFLVVDISGGRHGRVFGQVMIVELVEKRATGARRLRVRRVVLLRVRPHVCSGLDCVRLGADTSVLVARVVDSGGDCDVDCGLEVRRCVVHVV